MGRKSSGWKLGQAKPTHAFYVRFWHGGREYKRSTGTRDPDEAAREAARIYADIVQREPERPRQRAAVSERRLEEVIAEWLASLYGSLDEKTIASYEGYAVSHWFHHFSGVHHLTDAMCASYVRKRLTKVRATTVRKEASALRGFVAWLHEQGHIGRQVQVPSVPKRAQGTAHPVRRRTAAAELSPEQCEAFLAALPTWSGSRKPGEDGQMPQWPVRARFIVQYDAGLRSELVDLLSVPEHWAPGQAYIDVPSEDDKAGMSRRIYLTKRAQRQLKAVAPARGLIFGRHDYRWHIRKAAKAALPKRLAERFTAVHLRSAAATHWLDEGSPLTAVQYQLGHKHVSTTARYVRPSERVARRWFAAR